METEKASSFNLRSEALLNLKLDNVTIKGWTCAFYEQKCEET